MEFSLRNPVKLASHVHNENYYCSIFLRFEKDYEIRVIKLAKDSCITEELRRIDQEEDEDKKYHMI
jgi:hypothetical protein